jgi:putative PIN family toxin of toxin-antitoxin system
MEPPEPGRAVVLDTNVALDLLLFRDPRTADLREALAQRRLRWLALPCMRQELARVLHYAHLAAWMQVRGLQAEAIVAAFDAGSQMADPPPAAPVRCTDPDDQPFIDLAVAQQALLLSKDRAVLAPRARLAGLGVEVLQQFVTNRHSAVPGETSSNVLKLAHSMHQEA